MQRRILGEQYIWIRGLVTKDTIDLDRLVPDPDSNKIYLDDFETIEEFNAELERRRNG
jgi:hypothetical protein